MGWGITGEKWEKRAWSLYGLVTECFIRAKIGLWLTWFQRRWMSQLDARHVAANEILKASFDYFSMTEQSLREFT